MGQKVVIGTPFKKGLRTDLEAFNIDDDSFPSLINAYQWRGKVKRKRGTSILGRLQIALISTATLTLDGSGNGNLKSNYVLDSNVSIVLGSVQLTGTGGPFTDISMSGYLTPTGIGGPNTINYVTGAISIPAQAGNAYTVAFSYYTNLPVMGIEDYVLNSSDFPGTIVFDTKYSYSVSTASPYPITNITFYSNPGIGPAGYVPKSNKTPFNWNGKDYQQFGSINYQNAFWETNGVQVPFSTNNIGMQFAPSGTITYVSNTATTLVLTITNTPLIIGDFVFVNEFRGTSTPDITAPTLNFQSGYITASSPITPGVPYETRTVTITFPNAAIAVDTYTPGIVQYLTNTATPGFDCIRFFDGNGWVNFMPPLSQFNYSIDDEKQLQYYLVGAKIIYAYQDRLIFFGPVIQTSATPAIPIYLPDVAIYSWNGTPYYTASFQGPVLKPTIINPILCPLDPTGSPNGETGSPTAYFEDQSGYGGYVSAFLSQSICTVSPNADALIVGFSNSFQTRFLFTGNDLLPFNFYLINSELGSSSTFSTINMDEGVITRGPRGFIITSQTGAKRIDLDILAQQFQISNSNNGTERVCAQRDFISEWVYFTYVNDTNLTNFPNQTLQYNYRDDSWAIFNESYTTYGVFRKSSGFTWETVGLTFATWDEWDEPWEAGSTALFEPLVVGGNQQGFLIFRSLGVGESNSLYISSIITNLVTSPEHGLNTGDYIVISGALGTIGQSVNNQIFSVDVLTTNTFTLDPPVLTGTYIGGGLIKRMYVPFIQTKQFPMAWADSRKVRLGPQQYLLTKTGMAQITLLIYLSQDNENAYNTGPILPDSGSINDSLIYSTVLYTCPESTNLGLTPANINLQTPTASNQQQIWHRINTSLIGDTVQMGFTLSDAQMRSLTPSGQIFIITGASQASFCVLLSINAFVPGDLIIINGVLGMPQLNGNIYYVIAATSTSITINVDSTYFGVYISGGNATFVSPVNQFDEIEIHSIILDVSPSQLLS